MSEGFKSVFYTDNNTRNTSKGHVTALIRSDVLFRSLDNQRTPTLFAKPDSSSRQLFGSGGGVGSTLKYLDLPFHLGVVLPLQKNNKGSSGVAAAADFPFEVKVGWQVEEEGLNGSKR